MEEKSCVYVRTDIFDSVEMNLIKSEQRSDSVIVLAFALANLHARKVTPLADGSFGLVTDAGVLTEDEVARKLEGLGFATTSADLTYALHVLQTYNPFSYFAYDPAEMQEVEQ